MYLPLTNNPEEDFTVVIDEIEYLFKQRWNTLGFWTLDISGPDGVPFVLGVKIVSKFSLLDLFGTIPFDLFSDETFDPGRYDLESYKLGVTYV